MPIENAAHALAAAGFPELAHAVAGGHHHAGAKTKAKRKGPRSAKQKAATRKMLAANKHGKKRGKEKHHAKKRHAKKAKRKGHRTAKQKAATKKMLAANKKRGKKRKTKGRAKKRSARR